MDTGLSMTQMIKNSFGQYAGAVLQSRALVDVRDCVKPSARQIYYCLYTDNFTHDKPFKKTLKAIGSAMRMYIHGDSSCEGIIMRAGQPFSMRYPLIEVEGSYGNLTATENWAASRYTASRLSDISNYLLKDTTAYAIDEWVDNYDDTEQYPRVLASRGFYNIVNGSMGIGVGLASSIPQFNLKEVNQALITLLQNPNASFDEIYCKPDFATGGTIINAQEVKESLKKGSGKACIIQATIEYNKKDNALVVTELPYSVYTNTICAKIEKLLTEEKLDSHITGLNDLTGEQVCIKIYLKKGSDPEAIKEYLYANTQLQSSYGINMTMLENGRYPKVYGWKEALQAHLNHEKEIYINCYNHELSQYQYRLKIVEGIIKAIHTIDALDKTIEIIRNANSSKEASKQLQSYFKIDEEQAKAILDIKLSRLTTLDMNKLLNEQKELQEKIRQVQAILDSDELLKEQMIKRFKEVIEKYGDERRTKVIQKDIIKSSSSSKSKKEKIIENVVITFNPVGSYLQNIPLAAYRANSLTAFKITTEDLILLFSNQGRFFRVSPKDIKSCTMKDKGTAAGAILNLNKDEKIIAAFSSVINEKKPYMLFTMTNGMVKKTEHVEYIGNTRNLKGMIATKLSAGLLSVQQTNGNDIILTTEQGYKIRFDADTVRASGKNSAGVKGISLQENDNVIKCEIVSKTAQKEIKLQARAGKGKKY